MATRIYSRIGIIANVVIITGIQTVDKASQKQIRYFQVRKRKLPTAKTQKSPTQAVPQFPQPEGEKQQVLLAALQTAKGKRGEIVLISGEKFYRQIKDTRFEDEGWFTVANDGAKDTVIRLSDIEAFIKD